jgi:GTP-binding protein HflX
VRQVLRDIDASTVPELLVINKVDAADDDQVRRLTSIEDAIAVSARTGEGLDALRAAIGDQLRALGAVVELTVPYERGDVLAALHREGEVLVEVHDDEGTRVRARLGDVERVRFGEFVTG